MPKLRTYTDEQLSDAVKNSTSLIQTLSKIGLKNGGGSHSSVKSRIKLLKLDTSHFNGQAWSRGKTVFSDDRLGKYSIDQLFSKNSKVPRSRIRKLVIENNLLDYKCNLCDNEGKWNSKKLSLHLDHINGKPMDHRFINLRWLCPNCHSQTETYCRRKK